MFSGILKDFLKNYYKTVYLSGDLELIADCFDNLTYYDSFTKRKRYRCYWNTDTMQLGGEVKGKSLCLRFLFPFTRPSSMNVRIFNSSSDQLVVECFYGVWSRLFVGFVVFAVFLLLAVGICDEGVSSVPFIMWCVCLLYIIFAKLVVHIRFKREYNQFMQDLRQMLKEEPIHSSSQWKLLLYN